jgi:hypothetical protein
MGRTMFACVAVVLAAGALAGCREDEQGRSFIPDKGTYAGPAEPGLSKKQMEELTDRAALQGDSSSGGPGGGPATADSSPRQPPAKTPESQTPALDKTLSERLRLQSGN